jgi:hypothetical protein
MTVGCTCRSEEGGVEIVETAPFVKTCKASATGLGSDTSPLLTRRKNEIGSRECGKMLVARELG